MCYTDTIVQDTFIQKSYYQYLWYLKVHLRMDLNNNEILNSVFNTFLMYYVRVTLKNLCFFTSSALFAPSRFTGFLVSNLLMKSFTSGENSLGMGGSAFSILLKYFK